MSYKRISVRFNMDVDAERKAWEIIHEKGNGFSGFGEYQVIAVFKFDTNHEDFRYNEYTQMNEEQFKEFMSQVHARQCYDTGIDAEYGDQLITLSTCEYTYNNGRFVVVAKKV